MDDKTEGAMGLRYSDGQYLAHNQNWHEDDAEWKAAQVAQIMSANDLSPRSVCDVGCGTGGVLESLSALLPGDVELVGYEPARPAADLVAPSRRESIELISDYPTSDDRQFDLMLCLDVFEHVEDYYGMLRSIRPKAPLAIFHVPLDTSITTVINPAPLQRSFVQVGHIQHFTRATALQALEYCGYSILDARHTNPAARRRPTGSLRGRIGATARRTAARVNIDWAAKAMAGFPLLVLASTNVEQ